MAYIKNTWVDQEGQVRYRETQDGDFKILTPNYEQVTEIGTPVNADNMNHIEDGIADNDTAITTINSKIPNNASSTNKMVTQLDLDTKADVDLSNINASQTAKDIITTWGMPNYSKGISVSLPYTVTSSGFMFIQVSGYDSWHYATVNDKRIGASNGYSGGKTVGNGVVFPVSAGDVVSKSNAGGAYFYPMKGADE